MKKKTEEYTSISLPHTSKEEKQCGDLLSSSESQCLLLTGKEGAIKLSSDDVENPVIHRSKYEKASMYT